MRLSMTMRGQLKLLYFFCIPIEFYVLAYHKIIFICLSKFAYIRAVSDRQNIQ